MPDHYLPPLTRSAAINAQLQRQQESRQREMQQREEFVRQRGEQYHTWADAQSVDDPYFWEKMRSIDPNARYVPGFSEKVSLMQDRRRELERLVQAERGRQQVAYGGGGSRRGKTPEENNYDERIKFAEGLIETHLTDADRAAFMDAKHTGNFELQNEIYQKALGMSGEKDKQDAADKAEKEQDEVFNEQTAETDARIARLEKDRLGILNSEEYKQADAARKAREAYDKAMLEWKAENNTPKKQKDNESSQPRKPDYPPNYEKVLKKAGQDLAYIDETIGEHNLDKDRRRYKHNDDGASNGVLTSGHAREDLGKLKRNSPEFKKMEKADKTGMFRAEYDAEDQKRAFNDAYQTHDEVEGLLEQLTEQQAQLDPNSREYKEIQKDVAQLEKALPGLKNDYRKQFITWRQTEGILSDARDKRYSDIVDKNTGKFKDDNFESDFREVYRNWARDHGLPLNPDDEKNMKYDFRRAFADGELTIDTQSKLPDKYKRQATPEEQPIQSANDAAAALGG